MKIQEKVLLKNYSTFKIGGPAKYFTEIKSLDDLKDAIKWAKKEKEKFMILGGGSNILFNDQGFDGLVIRMTNNQIKLVDKTSISSEAGATLADLVAFSGENNLTGLEWAAGIPGKVGGAIRGNAGAFGSEIKNTAKEIIYFNLEKLTEEHCNNEECQFDYRQSVFKEFDHKIIWQALFELKPAGEIDVKKSIKETIKKRQEKHPWLVGAGSAGSIFKNPVVDKNLIKTFEQEKGVQCSNNKVPAGWLIDMCDLRGYQIGGAQVSDKQANFILNVDNSSAESIVILISIIKQKVRNTFGVQLEEEVEIVGY